MSRELLDSTSSSQFDRADLGLLFVTCFLFVSFVYPLFNATQSEQGAFQLGRALLGGEDVAASVGQGSGNEFPAR